MARPRKTASAPIPPSAPVSRRVNPTNKQLRGRDVNRIFKTNSNKIRNPKVKLDAIIKKSDLLADGWSQKEVTQLRRYMVLSNEFNNIKRAYDDTLSELKDKNAKVIEKVGELSGNSILLNETLLINVIEKKNPSRGIQADDLATKLKEKFGNVLSQYNIDLEAIIEEMKIEAAANQKTYKAMEIGRQDYSQHFQSFRRSRRNSLKEFGFSDVGNWLTKAYTSFIDFFGRIGSFLRSLKNEKEDLESMMMNMMVLEENKNGNVKPYARLYENKPSNRKIFR